MAAFYCDEDMAIALVAQLRDRGHAATDADAEGRKSASDPHRLLYATERGWIMLTHNGKDYELLHDAWHLWSYAWGVAPRHSGILVVEQGASALSLAGLVDAFIRNGRTRIVNTLHSWTRRGGWEQFPY